jgi:hypothetical protein
MTGYGGRQGLLYRAAANLGVRARVWNLAEICGRGFRPGVAQARETELTSGPGCQREGEPGKRGPRSAEGGARERGPGDAAKRACWAGRVQSEGEREGVGRVATALAG